MGGFKENKINTIEKGNEKGNAGIQSGERRFQELQRVKNLIDSIKLEDDEDMDMAESLNESYLEAGKVAHQEEVQHQRPAQVSFLIMQIKILKVIKERFLEKKPTSKVLLRELERCRAQQIWHEVLRRVLKMN